MNYYRFSFLILAVLSFALLSAQYIGIYLADGYRPTVKWKSLLIVMLEYGLVLILNLVIILIILVITECCIYQEKKEEKKPKPPTHYQPLPQNDSVIETTTNGDLWETSWEDKEFA